MWWVSLTHPVLPSALSGKFLLHIPCCLRFYLGSLSYTSRAVFVLFEDIILHISCWFCFYVGCLSYTSRATFIFIGEFLLHIPCCTDFYARSFSYTSHVAFVSSLSGEFLLHIPYWFLLLSFFFPSFLYIFYRGKFPYISRAGFIFIWGVSLNRLMLASFLSWEFLLHIPCWLYFTVGGFSYTSHAGFTLLLGGSLTHPMLAFFFFFFFFFFQSAEFLLQIRCWLQSYLGRFS